MIKQLFSAVFIVIFLSACTAQGFIGDNRESVKKKLEKHLLQTNAKATLQETDSSLVLPFNDPNFKAVDFTFLFDDGGKCIAEIYSGCDTCLAKYLQQALDKKTYGWKQHGPNRFLSNQRNRISMELTAGEKGGLLIIRKIPLNRREYQKVLEGLKN